MRTRNQEWALKAYREVKGVCDSEDEGFQKKFGAWAHRLPILIRTAGLVQALAFVETRGDRAGKRLLEAIVNVTQETRLRSSSLVAAENLAVYMRLTKMALAVLVWYKRFAQSVLGVEQGLDEGEPQ